jgi:hypothetical protein
VAYGLANILAVIPITPGGLGIIEGILIPALHGFGVPLDVAAPAVLGYRVVNFWLPIPVGGVSFLSLRFETLGWRQRLVSATNEMVEHPSQPSFNGATPPVSPTPPADQVRPHEAVVEGPGIAGPQIIDASGPHEPDAAPPPGPPTGSATGAPPDHPDAASG